MAIITADGLFHGDRLRRCSQDAQLYWHRYFVASNTCGRLELNYQRILVTAFVSLTTPPSEEVFWSHMEEYHKNFLLFLYEVDGSVWGQWDIADEMLPEYQLKADKRTPNPPPDEYAKWMDDYKKVKATRSPKPLNIHTILISKVKNKSETFEKIPSGLGREGKGRVGKEESKPTPPPMAVPDWIPTIPWNAFLDLRKRLRAPNTPHALDLAIKKLAEFRSRGQPPEMVLNQSILNGWKGVFELKHMRGEIGNGNRAQQRQDESNHAIREAVNRMAGQADGGDEGGVSEPDHNHRNGAGVSGGLGGTGNAVRAEESGDRADRVAAEPEVLPPDR